MKIITILNEKGGVGKTTLATTLAAGLAMKGLTGLLIDTDGQGDTSKAVGLAPSPNCYQFMMGYNVETSSLVERVPADFCPKPLFIVTGNDEIRSVPSNRNTQQIQDTLLDRFEAFGALDFVIFDTQPSPTSLHSAIATVTDYVLIPFEPESFAAEDMDSAINNMQSINRMSRGVGEDKARIIGLIPNRFDSRTVLHKQVLKDVFMKYTNLVWKPIPNHIATPSHQYMRETVLLANPATKAARAWQRVVDRVHEELFEVVS